MAHHRTRWGRFVERLLSMALGGDGRLDPSASSPPSKNSRTVTSLASDVGLSLQACTGRVRLFPRSFFRLRPKQSGVFETGCYTACDHQFSLQPECLIDGQREH